MDFMNNFPSSIKNNKRFTSYDVYFLDGLPIFVSDANSTKSEEPEESTTIEESEEDIVAKTAAQDKLQVAVIGE